jgi:hypothetical protein
MMTGSASALNSSAAWGLMAGQRPIRVGAVQTICVDLPLLPGNAEDPIRRISVVLRHVDEFLSDIDYAGAAQYRSPT